MGTEMRVRADVPATPARRGKLPSLEPYLAPDRAIRALGEVRWVDAIAPEFSPAEMWRWPDPAGYIQRSVAKMPSPSKLLVVMEVLDEALHVPPSREIASVAVAAMFDARARQPANPESYLSALVYDLVDMGFPPAVVVAACQQLRREQVFVPEIAEILAACTKLHASYRAIRSLAERAWNSRADAEAALEELATRKPPPAAAPTNPDAQPGDLDW